MCATARTAAIGRACSACVIECATPTTDSELKEKGFTKLVRRDKGVYENVTALDGESKTFEAGKPETMPDLKRRIQD